MANAHVYENHLALPMLARSSISLFVNVSSSDLTMADLGLCYMVGVGHDAPPQPYPHPRENCKCFI
jgi:hypothetical protein